jgi:hypothetical protein
MRETWWVKRRIIYGAEHRWYNLKLYRWEWPLVSLLLQPKCLYDISISSRGVADLAGNRSEKVNQHVSVITPKVMQGVLCRWQPLNRGNLLIYLPVSLKPKVAGTVEKPGSYEKFSKWAKRLLLGKSEIVLKYILFHSNPVDLSMAVRHESYSIELYENFIMDQPRVLDRYIAWAFQGRVLWTIRAGTNGQGIPWHFQARLVMC